MKVLIFGASGATGRELVDRALALGHDVTAFVRDPAKLKTEHPKLSVVAGNLADRQRLAGAIGGQDVVISALGVGKPLRHDAEVVDGVGRIVEIMQRQSVRRFVYLSFVGVRESRPQAGGFIRNVAARLLRNEIADHERKEDIVRASALDWTIVRAPKFTNGPATGRYRSGENISAHRIFPTLPRADVADFILGQMIDRNFVHKAPSVFPRPGRQAREALA